MIIKCVGADENHSFELFLDPDMDLNADHKYFLFCTEMQTIIF